jgi:predicted GIY-YIG superfamily endonuclease
MFHYVYILVSETNPGGHYIGSTADLNARLAAHNAGKVSHTSKYKPWRAETAVAFRCRKKAAAFEKYLKSGSGRTFARQHL